MLWAVRDQEITRPFIVKKFCSTEAVHVTSTARNGSAQDIVILVIGILLFSVCFI